MPKKAISAQCVVLVTNQRYLSRCMETIWQLRIFGRYRGLICVIVGDDLKDSIGALSQPLLGLTFLHFPELPLRTHGEKIIGGKGLGGKELKKLFQYHKFWVFSDYFRRFEKVLYLDAGIQVMASISSLLRIDCAGKIVAHSDSYPLYESTLRQQFNLIDFPETEAELDSQIDLNVDYFQTSMMLFDPAVAGTEVIEQLRNLLARFPNSKTNDQGIINVWALPKGYWTPLPTEPASDPNTRRFYDFYERSPLTVRDYILLKYPRGKKPVTHRLARSIFQLYWAIFHYSRISR